MFPYPADVYEFVTYTQTDDGPLLPPDGPGWMLISVNAAQDANAAILLVTWARTKAGHDGAEEKELTGY